MPGDDTDLDCPLVAEIEPGFGESDGDGDRAGDPNVRFDLCTQFENGRSLVDRLLFEMADFGDHLPRTITNADRFPHRQRERLGRDTERAVYGKEKLVGIYRRRRDGFRCV